MLLTYKEMLQIFDKGFLRLRKTLPRLYPIALEVNGDKDIVESLRLLTISRSIPPLPLWIKFDVSRSPKKNICPRQPEFDVDAVVEKSLHGSDKDTWLFAVLWLQHKWLLQQSGMTPVEFYVFKACFTAKF